MQSPTLLSDLFIVNEVELEALHDAPEMLQKTYLDFISREATLRESKSKMRSSNYSLVKRV